MTYFYSGFAGAGDEDGKEEEEDSDWEDAEEIFMGSDTDEESETLPDVHKEITKEEAKPEEKEKERQGEGKVKEKERENETEEEEREKEKEDVRESKPQSAEREKDKKERDKDDKKEKKQDKEREREKEKETEREKEADRDEHRREKENLGERKAASMRRRRARSAMSPEGHHHHTSTAGLDELSSSLPEEPQRGSLRGGGTEANQSNSGKTKNSDIALLEMHQKMQNALTEDLLNMTYHLKSNVQDMAQVVQDDLHTLDKLENLTDSNLGNIKKENQDLKKQVQTSSSHTWTLWIIIILVFFPLF